MLRAAAFALACLAGITAGVPASGAPLEPSGQIAYESNQAIHIVRLDGSRDRVVLSRAIDPAWSPDGTRLAVMGVGSGFSLEVVQADGHEWPVPVDHPRLVVPEGPPSWSPDGRRLVVAATPDPTGNPPSHLYVLAADGSSERQLTVGAFEDGSPSWSPDGRWIAFERVSGGTRVIDLIHPNGTGLRPLFLRTTRGGFAPAWSPGSDRLAFVAGGIWIDTVATEWQQPLTPGPSDRNPTWSPDGQLIAFATGPQAKEIDVIDADGTGRRPVVVTTTEASTPTWRPVAPGLRLLSHGVDQARPLRPFTVVSTVTATGAAGVSGVSFRATVTGAARIVSLRRAGRGCAKQYLGGLRATCGLGSLAPGAFVVLRLRLKPLRPGKLTIALAETSTNPQLDRSDDALLLRTRITS